MRALRRTQAIEHPGFATYPLAQRSRDERLMYCFFSSRSVDERKELV
jgi:hypothetical protein